jgi:NADH-ubiquinone oxidoreductase chain 1
MTEHSAVIFVFFFLAEYASIVLICIFTTILFLGGYLNIFLLFQFVDTVNLFHLETVSMYKTNLINLISEGIIFSFMLGIKTCFLIFVFI